MPFKKPFKYYATFARYFGLLVMERTISFFFFWNRTEAYFLWNYRIKDLQPLPLEKITNGLSNSNKLLENV